MPAHSSTARTGTTGDDTGTGRRGTQQDDTGRGLTLHGVRDGRADAGDAEEVLLRLLDALRDRGRDLARLAVADADESVAVAHDDERREAEATTALDDLRHAVDGHDALEELALLGVAATAVAALAAVAAAATPRRGSRSFRGGSEAAAVSTGASAVTSVSFVVFSLTG